MKKLSQYLNYLILILVLGFGLFYFVSSKKAATDRNLAATPDVKKPVNVDEVVNKYMQQTATQIMRDQVSSRAAIQLQLSRPIVVKKDTKPEIKPEDIPAEQQIWKSSQLKAEPTGQASAETLKAQDDLDKKEFARQYIENARKDGYHVILSPDLKVLSVTPIRQPSQFQDSTESFPAE